MQCSCAHSVKAAAHLHLLQLLDEAVAQGSKRERLQRIHKLVGRWTQVTWGALGDGLRRSAIEGGRQFLEDRSRSGYCTVGTNKLVVRGDIADEECFGWRAVGILST